MSLDPDRVMQENHRLTKEVLALRNRVTALESSRWWRLHPRFLLRRHGWTQSQADAEYGTTSEPHAFPVDFTDSDRELCTRVAQYTLTTPPRIYALARAVEFVVAQRLPGAIVECGVWRGGSMMAVALTLLRLGVTDRELYLYDTFEGMTEPGDEDVKHTGERADDRLAAAGRDSHEWAIAPLDEVRAAVLGVGYPEAQIHFV